jgi:Na+:H+ antiporter, NhaA family
LFYTSSLSFLALTGAAVCLVALLVLNRSGVVSMGAYILVGLVLWFCVLKSGVHATLAGVALGLFIPLRRNDGSSPLHELEHALHPYVKWLVLPLFAFANAGLPLTGLSFANLSQSVPLGIIAGLTLGKPIGVMFTVFAFVKLGLAKLPMHANWQHMFGVSCLAGIGFTMSLFIGGLAFSDASYTSQVRVGVVMASVLSLILGLAVLLPKSR